MTPEVRFGKPAIRGISTEVRWEHDQAGEDVAEIAESFGLDLNEVRWAFPCGALIKVRCDDSGAASSHD